MRISDWSSDVCSSDLEAEVGYRRATIDHFSLDGVRAGTKSNNSALSFMLNGLLDFGPDDGLQGFVGGGVGIARVDADLTVFAPGSGIVNDSDTGFAWQALAGIRTPLSDNWDIGLKYRYFQASSVDQEIGRASWRERVGKYV